MGTKLTSKVAAMAALIATMTVVGCGEKESQPYRQASETDVTEMAENDHLDAPTFNADSAYAFVAKQVAFGPRVPNTPSHVACGDWLAT